VASVADGAGTYTAQSRFGATGGTWGSTGTYPLVVPASGHVIRLGNPVDGETYDSASNECAWTRAAGTGPTARSHSGQGPVDYRGVLR
jgi:hypothetical protein